METLYLRRILAGLIDLIVAALPLWLLAPLMIILSTHAATTDQLTVQLVLLVIPIPSFFLYLLVQIVQISRGRPTPGRRLVGIKLTRTDTDDTGTGAGEAARRAVGLLVPVGAVAVLNLWPLLLLLPLLPLCRRDGRSLTDLVSATKVVRMSAEDRTRVMPWETAEEPVAGSAS